MGQLDEGLGRRRDGYCNTVAQGPVVATPIPGERGTNIGTPQHHAHGIDEKRRGTDGETTGKTHRGTMESELTLVNDFEAERTLDAVAPVIDHDVGGGAKRLPHRGSLFGTLDGLAVDPRHGIAGAQIE